MYKVEAKIVINKGTEQETMVQIKQEAPFVLISANLKGDVTNLPDMELIERVKEDFYVTNFFNRAEKEYVEELRKQTIEQNETLEEVQEAMMDGVAQLCEALQRIEALEELNKVEEGAE